MEEMRKMECSACEADIISINGEYNCPSCGYKNRRPVIVTRHAGLVDFLRESGIEGDVISHVSDTEQIRGRTVYGVLPLALAAHASKVVSVEMPRLSPDMRGKELTAEQMKDAGATLATYIVTKEAFY